MKPAVIDPPEIWSRLWKDFHGHAGWDIGANCGQTIPIMLDNFDQVIAFEPAEECWPYLSEFTGNLTWLPIALSDRDDHIELVELPDAAIRTVISRTIDSLIDEGALDPPDFMKVDTEGHELRVLFGAKKQLALHRPDLLIEFHSPELHSSCQALLESYDYRIETVRHPHYPSGSPLWFQHGWIRATQ